MNSRLIDHVKPVTALDSVVPSSSTPDYVSLRDAAWLTIVIFVKNATTVTGSAISLLQATSVAGGSAKALAFDKAYRNIDTAAGDTLAEFAVSSDTFTTDSTNSKNLMYVIEVDPAKLDVNNDFDCVRLVTGNATAATVTAVYFLGGLRYGGNFAAGPSAITD